MKKIITLAAIAMMVLSAQAANISIAQAVEIGNALKDGGVTSDSYTVEGYVVKLQGTYDNEKKDQCWFMSDDKMPPTESLRPIGAISTKP